MFINRQTPQVNLVVRNHSAANHQSHQYLYPNDHHNKVRPAVEMRKKIQNYSFMSYDKIGKGYSSIVYKGLNDLNGQTVAIKVIQLKSLRDQTSRHMLQTEIQCFKEVNHPNLLRYQNSYFTVNNCYIITQYCQSGDLAKVIKESGGMSQEEASQMFIKIYEGYLHFHNAGFIHRDIKPANIFLSYGQPKIADFGFCKRKTIVERENYNVGTPIYMSKQSLTANIYNEKTDVWALGITLYEMIFGHVPFKGRTQQQLRQQIERAMLIFPQYKPICDELKNFITCCLLNDSFKRISIKQMHRHPWIIKLKNKQKSTAFSTPSAKPQPVNNQQTILYNIQQKSVLQKQAIRISLPNDGLLFNKNKDYVAKDENSSNNRRTICSMQKLKICNPKKKISQGVPSQRQSLSNKSQLYLNTPLYTQPKGYPNIDKLHQDTQNKQNIHLHNKKILQVPQMINLKIKATSSKPPSNKKPSDLKQPTKKGIEKIVSLINYFRLLYKLFQKVHQANQQIYDSQIKQAVNKIGNSILIQFNRIFNMHLKCLTTKANLFYFSSSFWTEFSESERWQMYDYVIKKYKTKYANIIKQQQKIHKLQEGKLIYNWLDNFTSFYQTLQVLQDSKIILAKQKYLLCQFVYLLLNLVEISRVITQEGWQLFTQTYITAQQIVLDGLAININNYYQMQDRVKQKYDLLKADQ